MNVPGMFPQPTTPIFLNGSIFQTQMAAVENEGGSHRTDKDDMARVRREKNAANAPVAERVPDSMMDEIKSRFSEFLNQFTSMPEDGDVSQAASQGSYRDYISQAESMISHDTTTIYIDWIHLLDFDAEVGQLRFVFTVVQFSRVDEGESSSSYRVRTRHFLKGFRGH
jgi:hypothetical protein